MHGHSSKLIVVYVLVGIVVISSLIYSLNFSFKSTNNTTTTTLAPNTYELELGQSKTIKGIVYTFSRIVSDNRIEDCSNPLNCITTGEAEIEVQIGALGSAENLSISSKYPSSYANVTISIESLTPIPATDNNKAKALLNISESN